MMDGMWEQIGHNMLYKRQFIAYLSWLVNPTENIL